MKTFLDWIKANDLEDSLVVSPAEKADTPEGEEATGENTKRTGPIILILQAIARNLCKLKQSFAVKSVDSKGL